MSSQSSDTWVNEGKMDTGRSSINESGPRRKHTSFQVLACLIQPLSLGKCA